MSGGTVRPALREDIPAITRIYNEAGVRTMASAEDEPQTEAMRLDWLEEHNRDGYPVLVVCDADGGVIGWGSLSRYHRRPGYSRTAEMSVYLTPEECGKGYGGRLARALVEAARAKGLRSIVARIGGENEGSIRFHERLGFRCVGRLKDAVYKLGRWQDIVYLQLSLA